MKAFLLIAVVARAMSSAEYGGHMRGSLGQGSAPLAGGLRDEIPALHTRPLSATGSTISSGSDLETLQSFRRKGFYVGSMADLTEKKGEPLDTDYEGYNWTLQNPLDEARLFSSVYEATLPVTNLMRRQAPHAWSKLDSYGAWQSNGTVPENDEWMQMDIGNVKLVGGVVTQGRGGGPQYTQWSTTFWVQYSDKLGGAAWDEVTVNVTDNVTGNVTVSRAFFNGNSDANTHKEILFPTPVQARYIRIHVTDTAGNGTRNRATLRAGVLVDIDTPIVQLDFVSNTDEIWEAAPQKICKQDPHLSFDLPDASCNGHSASHPLKVGVAAQDLPDYAVLPQCGSAGDLHPCSCPEYCATYTPKAGCEAYDRCDYAQLDDKGWCSFYTAAACEVTDSGSPEYASDGMNGATTLWKRPDLTRPCYQSTAVQVQDNLCESAIKSATCEGHYERYTSNTAIKICEWDEASVNCTTGATHICPEGSFSMGGTITWNGTAWGNASNPVVVIGQA